MRKIILVLFVSFLVFAPLWSVDSDPKGLSLTYYQKTKGRALSAVLDSENFKYMVNVSQSADGSFTLQAPPFLCINYKDTLVVGELRDSRLFSLLIDPTGNATASGGFIKGKNLLNISTPSMKPTLSGIAICLENVDFISLEPMFNPASPEGFGVIGGDEHFFAGILFASQNQMILKQAKDKFQVDWNNLGCGERMVFSLLGANATSNVGPVAMESWAFVQNAWDMMLGGGTTLGWEINAKLGTKRLGLDYRIGGVGTKLKKLGDDPNAQRVFNVQGSTGGKIGISFSYYSSLSAPPSYGGTSQERTISYKVKFFHGDYSLECENSTDFGKDRGKVSKSVYTIKTSGTELVGKKVKFTLESTMNRMNDKPCYLSDTVLKFECEHASMTIKNGKALLTMTWEEELQDMGIKISLDQDRQITASLRFRDI